MAKRRKETGQGMGEAVVGGSKRGGGEVGRREGKYHLEEGVALKTRGPLPEGRTGDIVGRATGGTEVKGGEGTPRTAGGRR